MTEFDPIALRYDQEFSYSQIGTLLRSSSHEYLEKQFSFRKPATALDLGCGTGEDAIWMAKRGCNITAIDISEEMIRVAKMKAAGLQITGSLKFEVLDMHHMDDFKFEEKFDLIFSNFGAVNCLAPDVFKQLLDALHHLLNPQGRVILVVMPPFCLWESSYFLLKGRWKETFRRSKKAGIMANLGPSQVSTWYYSPKWIRNQVYSNYTINSIKPIGIALPPTYLEHFFRNKKGSLRILASFEKLLSGISCLSGISDHYLIEMERKG